MNQIKRQYLLELCEIQESKWKKKFNGIGLIAVLFCSMRNKIGADWELKGQTGWVEMVEDNNMEILAIKIVQTITFSKTIITYEWSVSQVMVKTCY